MERGGQLSKLFTSVLMECSGPARVRFKQSVLKAMDSGGGGGSEKGRKWGKR